MPSADLIRLYDLLEAHDWYFHMASSGERYKRGQRQEDQIRELSQQIGAEAFNLVAEYSAHVFSGAHWHNERLPKPQRPVIVSTFPGDVPTVHADQLALC